MHSEPRRTHSREDGGHDDEHSASFKVKREEVGDAKQETDDDASDVGATERDEAFGSVVRAHRASKRVLEPSKMNGGPTRSKPAMAAHVRRRKGKSVRVMF